MNSPSKETPIENTNCVNQKFSDRFFQKIFEKETAIRDLLYYVGESVGQEESMELIYQDPVLIGNRKNDLSFLWNHCFYYFFEHQSTENYNMPVRILFYVSRALENYLTGKRIFRKSVLRLPEVKCYVLFTGIVEKAPEKLESVQKLSDAYFSLEWKKERKAVDLELCVHCFHLKVTEEEMESFLKKNQIPKRLKQVGNISVQYAMFVNTVKYKLKKESVEINTIRAKQIVLETCELFLEREYLVNYLEDSEVIDIAMEQLSYEEVIRFQEREEGREEGFKEGEKENLRKLIRKKLEKGKSVEKIADELENDIDTIWKIIIEIKEEKNS